MNGSEYQVEPRFHGIPDRWLMEDKKVPRKQRHTARYMAVLTDKWGRFTLESGRHEYSVSPEYTCVNVWLKITATQVKVMDM